MHKLLITLAAFAAAGSASAVLDLAFTVPANKTFILAPGASGQLSGTITGATEDLTTFVFAPQVGFTFAISTGAGSLSAYLAQNTTADFTGVLGTVTAGNVAGSYNSVGTVSGATTSDGENLNVQVTPEPSAFAALGLGAAALLRRRRK